MGSKYVTEFAKRGLIHAIINIEKSCFDILNTVYLENAWCLVYEILHQSIVIQGNSFGVLFDGLLVELPAILDSFFTSTTSDYIGVVGRGWWGATKWRGKHTLCIHTCIMDPLVPELAQKVVKSVDNITTRSCETLQLGGLCLTASRAAGYKPSIHGRLICPRNSLRKSRLMCTQSLTTFLNFKLE